MTVAFNDPDRRERLRVAVRYLLSKHALERGHQSRLARHFDVSRQWVHQVVNQERKQHEVREEMTQLKLRFREASKSGEWSTCIEIASALYGLCPTEDDAVPALYALGYAHEKLGNVDDATAAYREVLSLQRGHLKARARLSALTAGAGLSPVAAHI